MTIYTPLRDGQPLDRLTPGQRDCLRLVAQLQSSKQIARRLGISPYTVDQRIARACKTLGATSRADAALMVSEAEGRAVSVLEPVEIDDAAAVRPAFPQLHKDRAEVAREPDIAGTAPSTATAELQRATIPFPTRKEPVNTMTYLQRLAWAAAIAGAGVIVVGMLLTSLAALKALS